jgi:hypothetical protein
MSRTASSGRGLETGCVSSGTAPVEGLDSTDDLSRGRETVFRRRSLVNTAPAPPHYRHVSRARAHLPCRARAVRFHRVAETASGKPAFRASPVRDAPEESGGGIGLTPGTLSLHSPFRFFTRAEVAELADALGSGPSSLYRECRFKSCPRHLRGGGPAPRPSNPRGAGGSGRGRKRCVRLQGSPIEW